MSLALPVYVINLEEDVERMAGIAARLQALDIPFRRFPAYRGRNIPDQWQQEFRSNRFRKLSFRLWLRCERHNLYIWLRRRLGLPVPASLRRVDAFGALPRLPRDKAQAGGAPRRP